MRNICRLSFWEIFILTLIILHYAQCTESTCCKRKGTSLDCSHCHLSSLPLKIMDNETTHLDLSHNNITHLPAGSFELMTSLESLNLLMNPLQQMTKESFKGQFPIHVSKCISFTRHNCCVDLSGNSYKISNKASTTAFIIYIINVIRNQRFEVAFAFEFGSTFAFAFKF